MVTEFVLLETISNCFPLFSKQFETEAVVERNLALTKEVLAEKYKDRLEESYKVKYFLLGYYYFKWYPFVVIDSLELELGTAYKMTS